MPDSDDLLATQRAQPVSLGLGERLRSARKARALSVTQVAESLRLEEASIVALEDGRFDAMGAPVFVRGHLKRYAQLVGLSTETVLDAYRAAVPDSDAPPALARPRERAEGVRMGPWAWWIAAALLVLGVIIAFEGRERGERPPAAPLGQTSTTDVPVPDAAPASATGDQLPAPPASGAGPEGAASPAPPPDTAPRQ